MAWPTSITSRSPVGFWRLGDSTGSTAADSSGGSHDGTAANVTFETTGLVSGSADTAATFNGTSSTIAVSHHADFNFDYDDAFSAFAIVNHDLPTSSNDRAIIDKMGGSTAFKGWSFGLNRGSGGSTSLVAYLITNNATAARIKVTGAVDIPVGVAVCVGITYDGSGDADGVELYLNGHRVSERTIISQAVNNDDALASGEIATTEDVRIGWRNNSGGIQFYKGVIDEVALFNTELSESDMAEIANEALAKGSPYTPASTPIPVILDMDMDTDIDDVLDLAYAIRRHQVGDIDLLGVLITSSATYSGACARRILDYYGETSIPVYQWQGATISGTIKTYMAEVVSQIPDPTDFDTKGEFTDSIIGARTLLAAATDGTVVYITGGSAHTLSGLLDSSGDGIDSRDGIDLTTDKVKCVFPTIGVFPDSISGVSDSAVGPTEAENVANNCPVPLIWNGVENGWTVLVGQQVNGSDASSPVEIAWDDFWSSTSLPGQSSALGKRCFVPIAIDSAVNGLGSSSNLAYVVERDGDVTVNTSTGRTTYGRGVDSDHAYMGKFQSDATIKSHVNGVLDALFFGGANIPAIASSYHRRRRACA